MSAKIIAVDKLATRARNCIPRESTLCTNRGELRTPSVRNCPNPLSRAQLSDNSSARIIRAKEQCQDLPCDERITQIEQAANIRDVCPAKKSPRRYLPNTFFTSPTFRSTLPATFSAVPRSRKSGFPIALPVSSLTLPATSFAVPFTLSVVLEFINVNSTARR
jgi:hypothetical protein